nr:tripartite tricarboxylate transporter substrate binding protein [Candidatus Tectomicrobia bacterium]
MRHALKVTGWLTPGLGLLLALVASALPAGGQWHPTTPVQFIVMAGRGGGADRAVRFLVDLIAKRNLAPVPFEVINEPGRSGGDALAALQKRVGDN